MTRHNMDTEVNRWILRWQSRGDKDRFVERYHFHIRMTNQIVHSWNRIMDSSLE